MSGSGSAQAGSLNKLLQILCFCHSSFKFEELFLAEALNMQQLIQLYLQQLNELMSQLLMSLISSFSC